MARPFRPREGYRFLSALHRGARPGPPSPGRLGHEHNCMPETRTLQRALSYPRRPVCPERKAVSFRDPGRVQICPRKSQEPCSRPGGMLTIARLSFQIAWHLLHGCCRFLFVPWQYRASFPRGGLITSIKRACSLPVFLKVYQKCGKRQSYRTRFAYQKNGFPGGDVTGGRY